MSDFFKSNEVTTLHLGHIIEVATIAYFDVLPSKRNEFNLAKWYTSHLIEVGAQVMNTIEADYNVSSPTIQRHPWYQEHSKEKLKSTIEKTYLDFLEFEILELLSSTPILQRKIDEWIGEKRKFNSISTLKKPISKPLTFKESFLKESDNKKFIEAINKKIVEIETGEEAYTHSIILVILNRLFSHKDLIKKTNPNTKKKLSKKDVFDAFYNEFTNIESPSNYYMPIGNDLTIEGDDFFAKIFPT